MFNNDSLMNIHSYQGFQCMQTIISNTKIVLRTVSLFNLYQCTLLSATFKESPKYSRKLPISNHTLSDRIFYYTSRIL